MPSSEAPPTSSTAASTAADLESVKVKRSNNRSLFRRSSARPQVARYHDHFSLQAPTSYVKFHDSKSAARVIYNQSSQLVIEENYDHESHQRSVTIKQIPEEASSALRLLRLTYTLVAAFFLGFVLIFTMQVMLFVALDFAIHAGLTDVKQDVHLAFAIGSLLTFPIMIHGFALAMMLVGLFVADLWKGHPLFRKFVCPNQNDEAVEWMFVLMLLIVPFAVMGATLMWGTEHWWEITALYWFFSVLFGYLVFVISVLIFEARVFVSAVVGLGWIESFDSFRGKVKACILLRTKHALGGYAYTDYMSFGTPDSVRRSSESRKYVIQGTLYENQRGIYARFSQWSLVQGLLYKTLESPRRLYSVDDITDRRPYVTTFSWSLEKYFCRSRKTRYVGIVKGPGAVTRRQLKSTIVCSAVGLLLIYFLLASLLVYMGHSWGTVTVALVVIAILSVYFVKGPFRRYKELVKLRLLKEENTLRTVAARTQQQSTTLSEQCPPTSGEMPPGGKTDKQVEVSVVEKGDVRVTSIVFGDSSQHDAIESHRRRTNDKSGRSVRFANDAKDPGESEQSKRPGSDLRWTGFSSDENATSMGVYSVTERYRVTEPTAGFSIGLSIFGFLLFGVFPTFCLYYMESWQLATVYLALAVVVILRYQTNAEVLVQEKGHLMTPDDDDNDEVTKWSNQSRLSQVAATISRGKSFYGWRAFYLVFSLALLVFGVQAIFVDTESRQDGKFQMTNDFYYEPQNSLHYQTCEMYRNLNGNLAASMADYVFLSALVYRKVETAATDLSSWYGEGTLTDRDDIVKEYRVWEEDNIPVYYRMFTAEAEGQTYAAVSVRGTQNAWDFFTDCQLWGAAMLFQVLRALLPMGYMWNPILDQMVVILSTLQTGTIERLSFYRSTTAFVDYLVDSGNYTSVIILGHSLGGGLAIITGAQSKVQAVAVSGPNALISRHRFGVTAEDLERYTFNIIPDRDPVAAIDDPTKNLQRIECRAPHNSLLGCHSVTRSLCETIYVCGTGPRPAICECTTQHGYPAPKQKPNTTRSFEEVCAGTGNGAPLMAPDQLLR